MADVILDEDGYVPFHVRCPNGHHAMQRYRREDWQAGLSNGRLVFRCETCQSQWPPSLLDKATILSRLK